MRKEKVALILSGGLDSTVLAYKLHKEGKKVTAISFDYNQRHKKELEGAARTTKLLGMKHIILQIPSPKNSALTDNIPIPEGHYAADNMKLTIVPHRNLIMLSIAAGIAEGLGITELYYGAHGGDHFIYWDTRPIFIEKLNEVLKLNDIKRVKIKAPFMYLDKGDIVALGKMYNVNFRDTMTCYKGEGKACGKCGACFERLEAFKKAGIKDSISYIE
jgi:7-cyano-7-deazaguanine synthase